MVSNIDIRNIGGQVLNDDAVHLGPRMVIFTDGGAKLEECNQEVILSSAVTYKEYTGSTFTPWKDMTYTTTVAKANSCLAEHLAVNEALSVVLKEKRKRRGLGTFPKVFIFTDSRHTIHTIYDFLEAKEKSCNNLGEPAYKSLARSLAILTNLRISVHVIWVRGHSGIKGNERADTLSTHALTWGLWRACWIKPAEGYHLIPTPWKLPEDWKTKTEEDDKHLALSQGMSRTAKRRHARRKEMEPSDDDAEGSSGTQSPGRKRAKIA